MYKLRFPYFHLRRGREQQLLIGGPPFASVHSESGYSDALNNPTKALKITRACLLG